MSGWAAWVHAHDGHVALAQVLGLLVALGFAAPALGRSWIGLPSRIRWALLGVGAAAAAISGLGFPLDRYDALGHEASYYEVYLGASTPSNAHGWEAYVTYPILRWSYWAIGGLVGRDSGPVPLIAVNAVARGLAVVGFGWLGCLLARRHEVGVVAAVLLCLHPVHAFWGAAIFHTSIPFAAVQACLVCALVAWRTGDARAFVAAAAAGSFVAAVRIEWGILAPLLAVLLLALGAEWGRSAAVRRVRFWAPALAVTAAYGATLLGSGGAITEQGGYHGISGYLESIGRQLGFVEIFDPWHAPWMLAAVVVGFATWVRQPGGGRIALALGSFAVVGHVLLATFNDYGYRHALLPTLGLLLGASSLGASLTEGGRPRRVVSAVLLGAVVLTSSIQLVAAASLYYASEEAFFERVEGFRGDELPASAVEDGSCYLITDSERLWEMGVAGSHFNLMDPGEAVTHYRAHGGCVRWLYDRSQWVWDSLGPRVRAAKMHYWFDWTVEGWVQFPDGLVAVVHRMDGPPWGIADDAPIPDTEFNLGDDDDAGEEAPAPEVESSP